MALCRESAMDLCKEIITTPLQTVNNEIEECSLGGCSKAFPFPVIHNTIFLDLTKYLQLISISGSRMLNPGHLSYVPIHHFFM